MAPGYNNSFTDLWPLPSFNLLVKFVSSRLQQFHIKIMVMQRFQPLLGTDPAGITTEVTLGPLDEIR